MSTASPDTCADVSAVGHPPRAAFRLLRIPYSETASRRRLISDVIPGNAQPLSTTNSTPSSRGISSPAVAQGHRVKIGVKGWLRTPRNLVSKRHRRAVAGTAPSYSPSRTEWVTRRGDVCARVGGRGRHRAPGSPAMAVRARRRVRAVPDLQQRTLALRTAPRSHRSRLPSLVRRPDARSKDAAVTSALGKDRGARSAEDAIRCRPRSSAQRVAAASSSMPLERCQLQVMSTAAGIDPWVFCTRRTTPSAHRRWSR